MRKRRKVAKQAEKPLDTFSKRPKRGRPGVRPSEISGRGEHYRLIFTHIWDVVGSALLQARTEEQVVRAFDPCPNYQREFEHQASLILRVLREPKFPKRTKPQRNFLADSLAGLGRISPRRSRDICLHERNKIEHHIIREEYYVECTCGYQGPALDGGCRKCGAGKSPHPILHLNWQ